MEFGIDKLYFTGLVLRKITGLAHMAISESTKKAYADALAKAYWFFEGLKLHGEDVTEMLEILRSEYRTITSEVAHNLLWEEYVLEKGSEVTVDWESELADVKAFKLLLLAKKQKRGMFEGLRYRRLKKEVVEWLLDTRAKDIDLATLGRYVDTLITVKRATLYDGSIVDSRVLEVLRLAVINELKKGYANNERGRMLLWRITTDGRWADEELLLKPDAWVVWL